MSGLEGEILEQRYAVVEVHSRHGNWVRCRIFDMQAMKQHEAVIELGEDEIVIELLDEAPAPPAAVQPSPPEQASVAPSAPPAPAPPPPATPPQPVPPAPPPAPPPQAMAPPPPPPLPAPPVEPSTIPPEVARILNTPVSNEPRPRIRIRTARLEAAWFAVGDSADEVPEEARKAEDGDVVIAASKIEEVATDITTGTYRRYSLDTSGSGAAPVIPETAVPPVPVASGNRRLVIWGLAIAGGLLLGLLLLVLLR